MTNKFDTLFEQVMTTLEEDKATVGKLKVGGAALTSDAREGKGDKGTVSFKKGAKVGEKHEVEDENEEEMEEKRKAAKAAAEEENKEEVEEKKKAADEDEKTEEEVDEKKKVADEEKLDELKMDKSMTMKQYFEKWRKENKKD